MKKNIAMLVIGALLTGLFNGCTKKEPPSESNPEAEKAAVAVADVWLKLVDTGQDEKSWQEAAEFFRNAVSQQDWQKTMETFRKPLGAIVSRTLKSTHYMTTAPGAPEGQYVRIQYDSSFENKKTAVETVVPMLDKDGKWRVCGYTINGAF
jgi:hypothetical protein